MRKLEVLHRIEVWDGDVLLGSIIPGWDGKTPYRLSDVSHDDLRSWWATAKVMEWAAFEGEVLDGAIVDGVKETPVSELKPEDLVGFIQMSTGWQVAEIRAPR